MTILVTGGAGYIGSHTCVELQNAGYDVVVLDNLSNASEKSLQRVEALTGKPVTFYKGDILDRDILNKIFAEHKIDCCIHFAGLKAVGESVAKPWEYYNNNIAGTLTLVDVMRQNGCKNIIFSSSATVYGDPAEIPITENCPKGQCTNPYGWTKSMLEQILTDIQKADPEWNVILLRYFNPIGAHKSGTMGENRWIALDVENQVGVLAKVSGLFSGKSYNLQSLTVGTTEDETVSRMTICVTSDDITFEQIKKQLNRMVEVIKVIDLTDVPIHMKEILFAKVLDINAAEKLEVFQIAQVFHVEVSDVGNDSVLLECKLTERRNNELIALLRSKFKRIEVVRGGAVAIESISTSCR